jgi:hypothetical protein
MAREAGIQRRIIKALEKADAYVFKVHQMGYGRKGIADVCACLHGRYIAIEVKQPGGRIRTEQIVEMHKVRKAGGLGVIVDDPHTVEQIIDELCRAPYDEEWCVIADWHERLPLPEVPVTQI